MIAQPAAVASVPSRTCRKGFAIMSREALSLPHDKLSATDKAVLLAIVSNCEPGTNLTAATAEQIGNDAGGYRRETVFRSMKVLTNLGAIERFRSPSYRSIMITRVVWDMRGGARLRLVGGEVEKGRGARVKSDARARQIVHPLHAIEARHSEHTPIVDLTREAELASLSPVLELGREKENSRGREEPASALAQEAKPASSLGLREPDASDAATPPESPRERPPAAPRDRKPPGRPATPPAAPKAQASAQASPATPRAFNHLEYVAGLGKSHNEQAAKLFAQAFNRDRSLDPKQRAEAEAKIRKEAEREEHGARAAKEAAAEAAMIRDYCRANPP